MNRREILLDKLSNINNGEMKELSADGTRVLLARVGDKCFAVGAYCTHYGAPLAEGSLVGDRITLWLVSE